MSGDAVLEAVRLVRLLGREGFPAVRDVSLRVLPGRIHALLGPNGAGKSTTVRMCATLLRPTSGSVAVDGVDAVAHPERARARVGLVLGGDLGFYPRASARDNLLFFADLQGLSHRERRRAVDRALERVDLADYGAMKVGGYSRGMRQRLHLARAILADPALLLLDEPTAGLDPDVSLHVRDLVRELAAQGVGVLLTSHSMPEVEELADVISVIGDGRIVTRGGVQDVVEAAGVRATTTFTLPASASDAAERLREALGPAAEVAQRDRLLAGSPGSRRRPRTLEGPSGGGPGSARGPDHAPGPPGGGIPGIGRQARPMRRQLRMTAFHIRQFVSVPYFVQVMAVTAAITALVQYLAVRAWGAVTPAQGWTRAGVIGLWSTATCAAGIIGFERHKGTLVHLVMAPVGALRSLAAVVSAAASFGLASFPVAWLTWAALDASIDFDPMGWARLGRIAVGALTLWCGALATSLVVAALFVLTPNAISYEGLLLVPAFLLSGVVFAASAIPSWLAVPSRLLPLTVPVDLLMGRSPGPAGWTGWLACTAAWTCLAGLMGRRALRLATRAGTLEAV